MSEREATNYLIDDGSKGKSKPKRAQDGIVSRPPGMKASNGTEGDSSAEGDVPAAVKQRFIQVGHKYHFPDHTLAFVDKGRKLKTGSDNLEVVRALVSIARARGWQLIQVAGSEAFRRQVWREATREGLEVRGYQPTPVEQAGSRPVDRSNRRMPDDPSSSKDARDADRMEGVLLAAGPAHYRFDPQQGQSYYLRLRTPSGERTLWGMDFERALVESRSQVKVGDQVVVEQTGATAVKLKLTEQDADGKPGTKSLQGRRNSWRVETGSWHESHREQADAFRQDPLDREALVDRFPALTDAVVSLWLGERFAQRHMQSNKDRERAVAFVKDRLATAVERGETINPPRLRKEVVAALDRQSHESGRETPLDEREAGSRGARVR